MEPDFWPRVHRNTQSERLSRKRAVAGLNQDHSISEERVITQDDARLFRAKVYLLESDPVVTFREARIEHVNPLPVYDDTGRLIGGASVVVEDGRVRADLVFDYASPERLDIETEQRVYAHPRGTFRWDVQDLPLSSYDEREDPARVLFVKLVGITLSGTLPEFGAQVVGQPA
jgi:hypothetical protein